MTLTDDRLAELDALCADATCEPWRVASMADARFIAAARTALPEALAEVRRLRHVAALAREQRATLREWDGAGLGRLIEPEEREQLWERYKRLGAELDAALAALPEEE